VAKVKVNGLVIPNNVKSVICSEDSNCLGERIEQYLTMKKDQHPFESDENKRLFTMRNGVRGTEQLAMVVIDRADNQLKILQLNKTLSEEILDVCDKKGNPAHPTKGYDVIVKKRDKGGSVSKEDNSKLTKEEQEAISKVENPFQYLKDKGTPIGQAKLGIVFGVTEQNTEKEEKVTEPNDDLPWSEDED